MSVQFNSVAFAIVGLMSLGGCNAVDLVGETGFADPSPNGNIQNNLGVKAKQYRNIDADGDGYSFKVGQAQRKLVALSGVIPGSDPGAEVRSGTGTYYGTFVLGGYQDVKFSGASLNAEAMADAGTIVLVADFDGQTIKGTGTGLSGDQAKEIFGSSVSTDILRSGELSVDGKINGREITGIVVYEGVEGSLQGIVGEEQAIGAYHGKGGEVIYAGGFSTESDIAKVAETFCAVNSCQFLTQP